MSKVRGVIALALLMMLTIVALKSVPAIIQIETVPMFGAPDNSRVLAATELTVDVRTFNYLQEYNDDDFEFRVWNGTYEVAGANVSLYNSTSGKLYSSKLTDGTGYAIFFNVPKGTYDWNVTWSAAPGIVAAGQIVSDGPGVQVTWEVGNLDEQNNDDDLFATILDDGGVPAEGLNFSIHFRANNTIYTQLILGSEGLVNVTNIPVENYTWKVTVPSGPYAGTVIAAENFTSDGTLMLVHNILAPMTGDPDYYDLEVFVYYETSIAPVSGVHVNVMYFNGTNIASKITGANGSVLFVDLPVAFVNWSVTYGGQPVGQGEYSYNLTIPDADLRDPIITSPGDVAFLYETENITITWHIEDEHPSKISVYVDGVLKNTTTWTEPSFDFTFNVTGYELGTYQIRLVAEDANSNTAEDIITLRIYENVTPIISASDDVEFYYTETGYKIQWNITEEHPDKFVVSRNGEEVQNGTINPATPVVTVSLDGLDVGVYNYTLMVNDTSGNVAYSSVTVTVKLDDIPPVIVFTPPDISYFRGDKNIRYNWTATDRFKANYTITVDGFVVVQEDWVEENIWFDFSGLSEGEHWVVLTVYDLGGNSASAAVHVLVSPPLAVLAGLVIGGGLGLILLVAAAYLYFKSR